MNLVLPTWGRHSAGLELRREGPASLGSRELVEKNWGELGSNPPSPKKLLSDLRSSLSLSLTSQGLWEGQNGVGRSWFTPTLISVKEKVTGS